MSHFLSWFSSHFFSPSFEIVVPSSSPFGSIDYKLHHFTICLLIFWTTDGKLRSPSGALQHKNHHVMIPECVLGYSKWCVSNYLWNSFSFASTFALLNIQQHPMIIVAINWAEEHNKSTSDFIVCAKSCRKMD